MAQTDASRRACIKYQKKLKAFTVRLKPEALARYQQAAKKQGKTFRNFVLSAMDKAVADENPPAKPGDNYLPTNQNC